MASENQAKKKGEGKPFSLSLDRDISMNDLLYATAGMMLALYMEEKLSQLMLEAENSWDNRLTEYLDRLMEKSYV